MKNIKRMVHKTKDFKNQMSLSEQKVTILNKSKMFIQNYEKLIEITDDVITLQNLKVIGKKLKIVTISKFFIEITGTIYTIQLQGEQ